MPIFVAADRLVGSSLMQQVAPVQAWVCLWLSFADGLLVVLLLLLGLLEVLVLLVLVLLLGDVVLVRVLPRGVSNRVVLLCLGLWPLLPLSLGVWALLLLVLVRSGLAEWEGGASRVGLPLLDLFPSVVTGGSPATELGMVNGETGLEERGVPAREDRGDTRRDDSRPAPYGLRAMGAVLHGDWGRRPLPVWLSTTRLSSGGLKGSRHVVE